VSAGVANVIVGPPVGRERPLPMAPLAIARNAA